MWFLHCTTSYTAVIVIVTLTFRLETDELSITYLGLLLCCAELKQCRESLENGLKANFNKQSRDCWVNNLFQ